MMNVAVIGGGWSGIAAARTLADREVNVTIYEQNPEIGGLARSASLNRVRYEPHGPHIFRTSNPLVYDFVSRFGLVRPYIHSVIAEVVLPDESSKLLAWPPQLDEIGQLPIAKTVERELAERPDRPDRTNLETFVISTIGPTLYSLFVRDYTLKQWGRPAAEVSASVAPWIEIRADGFRGYFRETWQMFPRHGYESVIAAAAADIPTVTGSIISIDDLPDLAADAVILTCPLDQFLNADDLEWRGIRNIARWYPTEPTETVTPAYVVNRSHLRVPYTRTVETKHASDQEIGGSVVVEEYPGAPFRHYPVPTPDRRFDEMNRAYQTEIQRRATVPVFFTGRLADYAYLNMDAAISRAIHTANMVGDHAD